MGQPVDTTVLSAVTGNKRKLVTIRTIDALEPIEGADLIEVATVEGWKLVVKRGEFNVGDTCVYFEIDSFLPDGNPAWQFLVDKSPREFEGARGHRLRTIKLKGQVSQGLALSLSALPIIDDLICGVQPSQSAFGSNHHYGAIACTLFSGAQADVIRELDFSDLLGVKKFEAPLAACLQGQAKGTFPSFLQKTDQERCQNLGPKIFGYDDQVFFLSDEELDKIPPEARQAMHDQGILILSDGRPAKVLRAQAKRDARYEISMKLDGSSGTFYVRGVQKVLGDDETPAPTWVPEIGACSRNLELKINDENKDNTFVRVLHDMCLNVALENLYNETGREIAVQGEIMGGSIQGNRENFKGIKFFVFDIFDIKTHQYLSPTERMEVFEKLKTTAPTIEHVPVLHPSTTLNELGLTSVTDLLKFAEGPSINHTIREGLVFKRVDGQFSFKAISNLFLTKEKD